MSCIAVVDDDASILDAVQLLLGDLDHDMHCFSNGRQFLSYLSDATVDLLILDPHLPGLDGYDIVASLDGALPTILLTAWPYAPLVSKLEESGVLDTLVKPVSAETLTRTVHTRLFGP